MQYVLLIHAAESRFAHASPADREAVFQRYGAFTREFFATGRAGDSAGLQPTATATSVLVRDGKRTVKDGPFAETREQLGGYYSLDAASEEEALAWAARVPDAVGGTVEVRPVIEGGAPSPAATSSLTKATHRQYALLIYAPESHRAAMTDAERGDFFGRYLQLTKDLRASGNFVGGEPLAPVAKARSVSVVDGRRVVRDGPFAETREQLGGYYRVWARDLDEAIAFAARIPSVEFGTVEVRPVLDMGAGA